MTWEAPHGPHDKCTACTDPACRCYCAECGRARAAGPALLAALKALVDPLPHDGRDTPAQSHARVIIAEIESA
ncbi:MAG: hypothetical protein LC640_09000 [Frankia sp.]|nr:hypothetical protein [Frankia sp.]